LKKFLMKLKNMLIPPKFLNVEELNGRKISLLYLLVMGGVDFGEILRITFKINMVIKLKLMKLVLEQGMELEIYLKT